jgi:hypothetical protein
MEAAVLRDARTPSALARWPRVVRALVTALMVIGVLGLALLLAVRAPGYGLGPIAALPLLALPAWMLLTRRTHLALAVLLVYLGIADGYLKLQTTSELPSLGRDILLYAIAAGLLIRMAVTKQPFKLPPLSAWVVAFSALVVIQLLNPDNQSALHSVASLRQHIEFVPLFFIGYAIMRSRQRLRVFFLLLLVVAAVNAVVALIQINLTPDQLSGWGVGYRNLLEGNGVAPRLTPGEDGGSIVRPPGLGSDMGFAGALGVVALPGALALIATARRNRRHAIAAALLLPWSVVAIVASQSRGLLVVGVAAVLGFAVLAAVAGQGRRLLVPALATLVLATAAISFVASSSGEGVFSRYTSVAPHRLIGTTLDARSNTISQIPVYATDFPFGAGIGSVGPASGVFGEARPLNAESQFTFMIIEVGVLGMVIFVGFQLHLFRLFFKRARRFPDAEIQLLLAALFTPLATFIVLWITGVTTTSSPNAPYIWFAAGTAAWWLSAGSSGQSPARRP